MEFWGTDLKWGLAVCAGIPEGEEPILWWLTSVAIPAPRWGGFQPRGAILPGSADPPEALPSRRAVPCAQFGFKPAAGSDLTWGRLMP